MKSLRDHLLLRNRYLLAICAGVMLAASFPRPGIAGFAWIAPGLMAAAALGKEGGERFRIGYAAGLAHYLTMLYWLLLIPYRWHGIPFGPAAGWLSLSAFLALYPAFWVWAATATCGPRPEANVPHPAPSDRPSIPSPLPGWSARTLWAMSGAALWVALEMFLTRVFGGFPWDLLGVSQFRMTPLIQIASVTGVYGVSFMVVWFSLSLLSAALMLLQRPTLRSVWVGELFLPALVVALAFNLGFRHIRHSRPVSRTVKVTLMQPSIAQTLIWDETKDDERFRDIIALCDQALTNQPDVLIWPESAVPKLLRYDTNTFNVITGLARRHHVWMIIGADDAEPHRGATSAKDDDVDYFNSSFLIGPDGRLMERYVKRSLVIFGEYIPLARWLPFLKWFTPIQGGFTPGKRPVPFELESLHLKTSVLICFEDIFPQLGRGAVEPDTDFLVNLTNDGWFGEGAAQWQQAATALFRTVENRVPLIRCTNNGLTCWIDAEGRLREIFRDDRDSIYGQGFMTVEIPVLPLGATRPPTLYNQHGDWFGWGCVGAAVLMITSAISRNRQLKRELS